MYAAQTQAVKTPAFAPQSPPSLALVKEKVEITKFRELMDSAQTIQAIRDILPSHKKKDVERILRIALMEYKDNPSLHVCSLNSVAAALMKACRLGLEVGSLTGHAFFIPYKQYKDGKYFKTVCTLQVGYKGYVELAYRMGNILSIRARTVYENDEFEIIGGTEDSIQHKICLTNKGKEIGYYVVVDIKNARPLFHYMSVEEIATHRKTFSKGGGEFWDKFPDQMAYKTIFIKLFKWLPNNSYLRDVMEIEGEDFSHSHSEVLITRQTRAEKIAGLISDGEDTKPEGDSEFQDSFESDEDADDLPIPLEENPSLQRRRERIY